MDIKEIRRIYNHANEIENINGVSSVAISKEHKDWLIEQAEKVEKYEYALKYITENRWKGKAYETVIRGYAERVLKESNMD